MQDILSVLRMRHEEWLKTCDRWEADAKEKGATEELMASLVKMRESEWKRAADELEELRKQQTVKECIEHAMKEIREVAAREAARAAGLEAALAKQRDAVLEAAAERAERCAPIEPTSGEWPPHREIAAAIRAMKGGK